MRALICVQAGILTASDIPPEILDSVRQERWDAVNEWLESSLGQESIVSWTETEIFRSVVFKTAQGKVYFIDFNRGEKHPASATRIPAQVKAHAGIGRKRRRSALPRPRSEEGAEAPSEMMEEDSAAFFLSEDGGAGDETKRYFDDLGEPVKRSFVALPMILEGDVSSTPVAPPDPDAAEPVGVTPKSSKPPSIILQISLGDAAMEAIREALKGEQVRSALTPLIFQTIEPWTLHHNP